MVYLQGSPVKTTTTTEASGGDSSTTGTTGVYTPHDSTTAPTPSNEVCEGEEGFHRDPEDCGHFFNCISFDGELMALEGHCDDGLAFDLGLQTCNWENSVDCSAKVAIKSFCTCFNWNQN